MPAIGGAPSSAVASPTMPLESTTSGSTDGGTRNNSSVVSFQPRPSPCMRPVTAAFDRSVTCSARRQRPRDPRVDGAEAEIARAVGIGHVEQERQLRRRRVRRDPQPLLAQHQAHAGGAQVLPADAGSDGLAGGAIPHDRRCPLVGDPDGIDRPAVGQGGVGAFERGLGHRHRIELDEPGRGRRRQERLVVGVADGGVGADDRGAQAAGADIDDEERSAVRHRDDPSPRVSALGDEAADDTERRHQQRVEDVHDRRSQLVVADDAHEDGDGLRERVRDDRGERAVGERGIGPLRSGDEPADQHPRHDHEEEHEHAVVRLVVHDDRADQSRREREHERRHDARADGFPIDRHQNPVSPNGLARPSLPGLRMPFGSRRVLSAASTSKAGPSASRTKRDRLSPTPW